MIEVDSIIRDPSVAIEFAKQIFPPKVQQSMIGRQDFEVFREGVHGAVKGLYTTYEIGMRLRAARREIEHKDERIRNLEARAEKVERELRKVTTTKTHSVGLANLIVEERVAQRLISHTIADCDTASMFAIEAGKTRAYGQGCHAGRKFGIEKTKEKLAKESANVRTVDLSTGGSRLSRPQSLCG